MTHAIYVRTSQDDNDGESQLHELRTWARGSGWAEWAEYIDRGVSGAKDSRPAWDKLQTGVRRGKIKCWAATEMARLGRGGVIQVAPFLHECCGRGVRVVLTRTGLDYSTPTGRLVANILLEVAAMERELATERLRAGIARAREHGTRSGRPIGRPASSISRERLEEMWRGRGEGLSWAWLASRYEIPATTIRRALLAYQKATIAKGMECVENQGVTAAG